MPDLDDVRMFLADETGLATISTVQADGQVLSNIANCWVWVSVTGPVDLIGPADPADPADGADAEALRVLLREIYAAAGGHHDDLADYDRVMVEDARTAVLVSPERIIGNVPRS